MVIYREVRRSAFRQWTLGGSGPKKERDVRTGCGGAAGAGRLCGGSSEYNGHRELGQTGRQPRAPASLSQSRREPRSVGAPALPAARRTAGNSVPGSAEPREFGGEGPGWAGLIKEGQPAVPRESQG